MAQRGPCSLHGAPPSLLALPNLCPRPSTRLPCLAQRRYGFLGHQAAPPRPTARRHASRLGRVAASRQPHPMAVAAARRRPSHSPRRLRRRPRNFRCRRSYSSVACPRRGPWPGPLPPQRPLLTPTDRYAALCTHAGCKRRCMAPPSRVRWRCREGRSSNGTLMARYHLASCRTRPTGRVHTTSRHHSRRRPLASRRTCRRPLSTCGTPAPLQKRGSGKLGWLAASHPTAALLASTPSPLLLTPFSNAHATQEDGVVGEEQPLTRRLPRELGTGQSVSMKRIRGG